MKLDLMILGGKQLLERWEEVVNENKDSCFSIELNLFPNLINELLYLKVV